ncbi:hypothetical protein AOA14_05065 [Sphingopyxis terrae subsp. terrae NBRC 15098]|uniref:Uncharacterized protein n=1 Tax=Sphingopyxis terrae subsp. terrae NBRC 15098 TaxID=1219058 RepID=A0A142VW70_9SPHN|nr:MULTISPECIES: hypothetical protein [Sphingopyxis]AMU93972.1 hypothetical protein AOA14_05065 [Sphingopyxis terrae subsp. terrae NBRC 15098]
MARGAFPRFGTITVGLWLSQSFPQDSFAAEPGYGAPVLAFEFAGGQDDLLAIFGPDSDARQAGRVAAMRGRPLLVAPTELPLRPVVRPSARRPASPPATGFGRRRR